MNKLLISCLLIMYFCKYKAHSLNLPGPLVYVVTPSPRPPQEDEGRSAPAPFYYHNWMRRMDPPKNATTTTTQTPDLIFADFESGNKMKSIRKLLEKERAESKTTTTARPIYVPDETKSMSEQVNYGLPPPAKVKNEAEKSTTPDMTDYFALYNNMYNVGSAPVSIPLTTPSTTTSTSTASTMTPPPPAPPMPNVQNIWHIIDSQKYDDFSGKWEEVANGEEQTTETPEDENMSEEGAIDDHFSLPGFGTNPGNGAENESRAIRTEPNTRFPYVNLKPFQVKTQKKPLPNTITNSKKGNNMYTSLDNFYDIKKPVRGEVQDTVALVGLPLDRYNSAQPYLPKPSYGSKSKQSSPNVTPMKAVASLVPPPPRFSDGDFPAPTSYESFPPYSMSAPQSAPAPPSDPTPAIMYQPPVYYSDDSDSDSAPDSDGPPINVDYQYKPPSPPALPFIPTLPPLSKPSNEYSYDKPQMGSVPGDSYSYKKPSPMPDSPVGGGYSYDKPMSLPPGSGYSYDKPSPDSPPGGGYSYDKPANADATPDDDKPDFQGYHYSKPKYSASPQESPPSYGPGPDFHGGDLKFTHDFGEDDHDFHHYHHHHTTTTTTTTTETPRVNRFSYYYLGKKLYYLPLYFSVYFIVYVAALIIKAVLRHKIVYPNSWRPNDQTAGFFSKRSLDSYDFSNENLHEITGKVTHAIAEAGKKYLTQKKNK